MNKSETTAELIDNFFVNGVQELLSVEPVENRPALTAQVEKRLIQKQQGKQLG